MPWKFSNDSEWREKVFVILSSVNCGRVYFIHLKKSFFVEDMFYPKNEEMAFPNIGMRSMQELFFQLGGLRWDTLCT